MYDDSLAQVTSSNFMAKTVLFMPLFPGQYLNAPRLSKLSYRVLQTRTEFSRAFRILNKNANQVHGERMQFSARYF